MDIYMLSFFSSFEISFLPCLWVTALMVSWARPGENQGTPDGTVPRPVMSYCYNLPRPRDEQPAHSRTAVWGLGGGITS